jgi:hypothetical protein
MLHREKGLADRYLSSARDDRHSVNVPYGSKSSVREAVVFIPGPSKPNVAAVQVCRTVLFSLSTTHLVNFHVQTPSGKDHVFTKKGYDVSGTYHKADRNILNSDDDYRSLGPARCQPVMIGAGRRSKKSFSSLNKSWTLLMI